MLEARPQLRQMLIRHEGLMLKVYRCPTGKLTIGVGRNLEDNGITNMEAMALLTNDIERAEKEAAPFGWFNSLSVPRQDVVIGMIFQMGLKGFKGFKKLIAALIAGNFEKAAKEMLESSWAKQTPSRAQEMAEIMKRGGYR